MIQAVAILVKSQDVRDGTDLSIAESLCIHAALLSVYKWPQVHQALGDPRLLCPPVDVRDASAPARNYSLE
jgi:hypothetical protein